MQIIIGFAICLVFFLCLALSGYVGYRIGTKKPRSKLEQLTEQEKIIIKQREQGFKNVMNYDIQQAMGIKR